MLLPHKFVQTFRPYPARQRFHIYSVPKTAPTLGGFLYPSILRYCMVVKAVPVVVILPPSSRIDTVSPIATEESMEGVVYVSSRLMQLAMQRRQTLAFL